ncbi:MAG: hypothetical protein ACK41P_01925 [Asticcacaulis sp.]
MRIFIQFAIVFGFGAMASTAMAQTQGTLGSTSTGSHDVTINLTQPSPANSQVRISGLDNVNLGTFPTNHTQAIGGITDFVCFYNNSPSFSMTVSRISNPEKPKGFKLVSNEGHEIPLYLKVRTEACFRFMCPPTYNSKDSSEGLPVITDGVSIARVRGNTASETCQDERGPGSIFYSLASTTIPANTPAGNYRATIQITLAAE